MKKTSFGGGFELGPLQNPIKGPNQPRLNNTDKNLISLQNPITSDVVGHVIKLSLTCCEVESDSRVDSVRPSI